MTYEEFKEQYHDMLKQRGLTKEDTYERDKIDAKIDAFEEQYPDHYNKLFSESIQGVNRMFRGKYGK
jgi:hypothetical protein